MRTMLQPEVVKSGGFPNHSNIRSLRSFRSLLYFKFNLLSFVQGAIPLTHDGCVMNEYVGSVFATDETVPFGIVEPLYCAFFHGPESLLCQV
jgi:hypothetical protein